MESQCFLPHLNYQLQLFHKFELVGFLVQSDGTGIPPVEDLPKRPLKVPPAALNRGRGCRSCRWTTGAF